MAKEVIRVSRDFPDLLKPYLEENIPNYLGKLELGKADKDPSDTEYLQELPAFQDALKEEDYTFFKYFSQLTTGKKKGLIVAFQGRDAAGKSSSSEHIFSLDPKKITYSHITAPSDEELKHGYLWRFSKYDREPPLGEGSIFDRCWAERVLSEKVMKITAEDTIQKSYAELRAFEWLLYRQGYIFVKMWIEISEEEQRRRFDLRQAQAPWKLSATDEISHANWEDYSAAANELFYRTGTSFAPWYIISGMDRQTKLLTVMRILNRELEKSLND